MIKEKFELSGRKIILRPFTEIDITESYINWLNDPVVTQFSNQRFLTHNYTSCLNYLRSFSDTDNLFLKIIIRKTNQSIGTLTSYFSHHHGTVDVGILIGDKTVWGQGYGQDAWDTITSWLISQKNIRKLTAGTLACNKSMIKLMERSGMQLEAVKKFQEIVNNSPVDVVYYAKFKDS